MHSAPGWALCGLEKRLMDSPMWARRGMGFLLSRWPVINDDPINCRFGECGFDQTMNTTSCGQAGGKMYDVELADLANHYGKHASRPCGPDKCTFSHITYHISVCVCVCIWMRVHCVLAGVYECLTGFSPSGCVGTLRFGRCLPMHSSTNKMPYVT